MANKMDDLKQSLLQKHKNLDMSAINQIMQSDEAQALKRTLSSKDGSGIKDAAAAAADGDSKSAAKMMSALLSSPEGKALVNQISKMNK